MIDEVTVEECIEAYERHGTLVLASAAIGLSKSVLNRRLLDAGYRLRGGKISEADREEIYRFYRDHSGAAIDLEAFSKKLGLRKTSISRIAREFGLTSYGRAPSERAHENLKRARKDYWKTREHPRGYLGHTHGPETKEKLSAKSKEVWERMKRDKTGAMSDENLQALSDRMSKRAALPNHNVYSRSKSGVREDLGIFVRSGWEANYARYLEWLKARGEIEDWAFEPETFWFEKIKRGVRSYKPDFKVKEKGRTYYVEVKGWMDAKSKTKLARMAKYHPSVEVRLVGKKEYQAIAKVMAGLIVWE